VPHYAEFDASVYGWGTENWVNLMKYVLRAAKALPGPFKVDFTVTAHWPPALNTIDPNDVAASQELSYAYAKVRSAGEVVSLPMPEQKTQDRDGADFIFTDTFVAATLARVAQVDGDNVTLDTPSMRDVSAEVSQVMDPSTGEPRFTPAGIPQDSTEFGDKPKLADRQYSYQVNLAAVEVEGELTATAGDAIQPGDWLLFGFYRRGTGQTLSGTGMMNFNYPMADRLYATDYYSAEGIDAVIDYWNQHILSDDELKELLTSAAGDIFEDSIESSSSGPFWTHDLLDEFKQYRNYDLAEYLPLIASLRGSAVHFRSSAGNQARIQEDYSVTLNDLYLTDHVKVLQDWTRTYGFGYRAQAYGGSIDTSGAATVLDVSEGESLGFRTNYDNFRNIAGGVHMAGKKFVSDEALANGGSSYALTWQSAVDTLNSNYAAGVNRMVIHGTAFAKGVTGAYSQWPGWHAFGSSFAEPWGPRQTYWQDVGQMAGFIARNQAVFQNGRPRMDVAIYKSAQGYGRGFPELLDNGYSYDIVSTPSLLLVTSVVRSRMLSPDGPSYRALIVNDQETMPLEAVDQLIEYARAGLPIIIYGQVPGRVPGASGDAVTAVSGTKPTDAELAEKMEALLAEASVARVAGTDALVAKLEELGAEPSADYSQAGLRSLRRLDSDGTDYYFLFNVGDGAIDAEVSLEGQGTPYGLNAWTGEIAPIVRYTTGDGRVTTGVTLAAGESTLIAISGNSEFGNVPEYHVTASDADVRYVDGAIVVRSEAPGTFTSTLSDSSTRTTEIAEVGERIPIETWNLSIESWGPGGDPSRPTIPEKVIIPIGAAKLGTWDSLTVSPAALEAAGVNSMDQVSGIGIYIAEVTLPQSWTGGYGAYLDFQHGDDMITEVVVNGETAPVLDPTKNRLDVGPYLHEGANSIRVKLVTTLNNRIEVANEIFQGGGRRSGPPRGERRGEAPGGGPGGPPGGGFGGPPGEGPGGPPGGGMPGGGNVRDQHYGLTEVTLIPYGQAAL